MAGRESQNVQYIETYSTATSGDEPHCEADRSGHEATRQHDRG
jgi:hypothetical protein